MHTVESGIRVAQRVIEVQEDPLEEWSLMRSMMEHSMEPMLLTYITGKIIYVNPAMCSLIGKSAETLLKEGRAGIMDLSDPRLAVALEIRRQTGHFKGELLCRHADGSPLPVELSTSSFQAPSGRTVASIHMRDLRPELLAKQEIAKQRKEMESALSELQMVMDNTLDIICVLSSKGRFTRINSAVSRLWGYQENELIGTSLIKLVHPDEQGETLEVWLNSKNDSLSFKFRNRFVCADGSVKHMDWSCVWAEDKLSLYCIGRDITQIVAAEEIKQKAEARLQALMKASSDTIVILQKDGTYSYIGASVPSIIGLPQECLLHQNAFELIHPEDREYVQNAFQNLLSSETIISKPYRHCTPHPTGWGWFEASATNCLDNPDIQGIMISIRDITERHLAELELQRSEQRYRALFEYNPDGVYSLNKGGYFTSVNKGALALLGFPEEEILNKHFNDFAHPDYKALNEQNFKRVLAGEVVTTETSLINADNEEKYYMFTEIPIRINGKVVGVHGLSKDVTLQKQQRKLLEQTAQQVTTILESIQDAFFALDHNWCFTYANPECLRILDLEGEEVIGNSIMNYFPELESDAFYERYKEANRTQQPVHFIEYLHKKELWLEVNAYPSPEGISVYFKGINDRIEAEKKLKKLSLVASRTVNSVYITDDKAQVEWVNEGFTRITGYTLEEVIGLRLGDILAGPEMDAEKLRVIREKLTINQPLVQEVQNRHKNGDIYWARLDVTPIEEDGEKKFVVIETVITDEKRAEQERMQLTEELLRRNRNLEQFTYIVSHNLRAPVANILGLSTLLNISSKEVEEQERIVEKLRQSSHHLDTIIRDLNDLLSLQQDVSEKTCIELGETVEQTIQMLPLKCQNQVQVELNGLTEIWSVRSYFSSILSNLLSNAVKYRDYERPLQIKVSTAIEGDNFKLSVSDNGLGINLEKDGKKLFGLYKRFHHHVGGKGIGLYLVKTQAEALGGHVEVQSQPGEGTTFHVFFPMD